MLLLKKIRNIFCLKSELRYQGCFRNWFRVILCYILLLGIFFSKNIFNQNCKLLDIEMTRQLLVSIEDTTIWQPIDLWIEFWWITFVCFVAQFCNHTYMWSLDTLPITLFDLQGYTWFTYKSDHYDNATWYTKLEIYFDA